MNRQLLLFAEPLLREGLTRLIEAELEGLAVVSGTDALRGAPQLVLWAAQADLDAELLSLELQRLQERWHPAPVLLLLPAGHRLPPARLLELPATGLLEAPEPEALIAALRTLLAGGRVLELQGLPVPAAHQPTAAGLGLGPWLLLSGLRQVDADIQACQRLLQPPPDRPLQRLALEGRLRELRSARRLLLVLWGPASLAWPTTPPGPVAEMPAGSAGPRAPGTALTLQQRNADGIWASLAGRLERSIASASGPASGQLLALAGLRAERRHDLLLALLEQLGQLRRQLASEQVDAGALEQRWLQLQPQLRQQALRAMASPYVQLPRDGALCPVAEQLIRQADLEAADPELPPAQPMLNALLQAQPLLVEGQLLPADEPRAVLHLELLVANWLLRTAELLAGDVLAAAAAWPELRRYLLLPDLLSTRNLERLRNQLNTQQRWQTWWERPRALYESRRVLLTLGDGGVSSVNLVEPRDDELRQLGWAQQLITLSLETRDALAPQVQGLVRGLGNLLVVLLTQVLGRAIGLVGRGILQGMGRGLRTSQ